MKSLLTAAAILLPTVAFAADMPIKAPAGPVAAIFNWTGFYIGVNAGYGWGSNDAAFAGEPFNGGAGNDFVSRIFTGDLNFAPNSGRQRIDSDGAIGGAQAGYNRQFASRWVAGIEADIQGSGVSGNATAVSPTRPLQLNSEEKLRWFGTVRGRLGFLVRPNILLYGTGGLAYGETDAHSVVTSNTGFAAAGLTTITCAPATPICMTGDASPTRAGWTAGAGVELALTGNVTVRAEYLHLDLGDQSVLLTTRLPSTGDGTIRANFQNRYDIVRTGLNYRFGGPVVAKY